MNIRLLSRASRGFGLAVLALAASLQISQPLVAQQPAGGPDRSGWIGISFADDPNGQAIIVQELVGGDTPAQAAGIRVGDRIVRWNGRTDVATAIRSSTLRPGDNLRIRIARAGEAERDLTLTVALRPAQYAVAPRVPSRFGEVFVTPGAAQRVYRLNRDSLAIQMDSLNAQLRLMLQDSLGTAVRFRALEPSVFFRDSTFSFQFDRSEPLVIRYDSLWASPIARDGSLAIALATSRNAVAGAELTDITPGLSSYFGTDRGVLITRVAPETPAARAGLRDGDVIVRVGDQAIAGVAELRWALSRPGPSEFSLEIVRERARRTVTLGR